MCEWIGSNGGIHLVILGEQPGSAGTVGSNWPDLGQWNQGYLQNPIQKVWRSMPMIAKFPSSNIRSDLCFHVLCSWCFFVARCYFQKQIGLLGWNRSAQTLGAGRSTAAAGFPCDTGSQPCPRESWSSRPWFLGDLYFALTHVMPPLVVCYVFQHTSALRPNFTMLSWRRHCERVPTCPVSMRFVPFKCNIILSNQIR